MKRHRARDRRPDGQKEPDKANPQQLATDQTPFLTYESAQLEQEYLNYLHPRSVIALPFCYFAGICLYATLMANNPGPYFGFSMAWYAVAFAVNAAVSFRSTRDNCTLESREWLLMAERWVFGASLCFSPTFDHWAVLQHFSSCNEFDAIAIDDRKVFMDAHCSHWWSPFSIIAVAFGACMQLIPFRGILFLSVYNVLVLCVLWLANPPPDPLFQVWLFAVWAAAGLAFVSFVRFDQEQEHRKLFEKSKLLEQENEILAQRQRELQEFCSLLVPRPVLSRLDDFDASCLVDSTDNGSILMLGVHDFGVWCTQNQPRAAALAVTQLHTLIRVVAAANHVDVMGSMGDTVVISANLVQHIVSPAIATCSTAAAVFEKHWRDLEAPPLRAAAHHGRLEGGFVGSFGVRYDAFGECFDVAQEALCECPPDRLLMSATVVDVLGPLIPAADAISPAATVQGVVFSGIHTSILRDVDSYSGPSDVAKAMVTHQGDPINIVDAAYVKDNVLQDNSDSVSSINRSEAPLGYSEADSHASRTKLAARLDRCKEVTTIWCCFPRFVHDDVEAAYISQRMDALPGAASRTWFAYALYVFVLLALLLVDFHEPHGIMGAVLLIISILIAVVMGVTPKILSRAQLRQLFFPWSVLGVLLPLLVVYGCASSRPSAVGNDARLFLFIGAQVRSYCFTGARWQAVFVPLSALVGLGQYALPGGYLRITIVLIFLCIAGIIIAERGREENLRANARNNVELRLVSATLTAVDRVREGLLRNAVPREVFKVITTRGWRSEASGAEKSFVRESDGMVLVVRAASAATSPSAKRGNRNSRAPRSASSLFALLDKALSGAQRLSLAALLGDQALVVGPVRASRPKPGNSHAVREENELSILEAIRLGSRLCGNKDSVQAQFSVVADFDAIVHAVEHGSMARYVALGVTVTRMLSVVASADVASLAGQLVTDRVLKQAEDLGFLEGLEKQPMGPMKFRGVGLIRFTRLQKENRQSNALPLQLAQSNNSM